MFFLYCDPEFNFGSQKTNIALIKKYRDWLRQFKEINEINDKDVSSDKNAF